MTVKALGNRAMTEAFMGREDQPVIGDLVAVGEDDTPAPAVEARADTPRRHSASSVSQGKWTRSTGCSPASSSFDSGGRV
jgi:hypothetical protein